MTLQCLEGVLSPISAFFSVSASLSFSEQFLYAHGCIPRGTFEYMDNDGCWVTSKQHPEFQMKCRIHHGLLCFLCLSVVHLWATPLLHSFFLLLNYLSISVCYNSSNFHKKQNLATRFSTPIFVHWFWFNWGKPRETGVDQIQFFQRLEEKELEHQILSIKVFCLGQSYTTFKYLFHGVLGFSTYSACDTG